MAISKHEAVYVTSLLKAPKAKVILYHSSSVLSIL